MTFADLVPILIVVGVLIALGSYWLLRAEPHLIWGSKTAPDQQIPVAVPTGKTVFIETAAGGLNRFEMFYREAGAADKPVVLLLHGMAGSSDTTWYATFAALTPQYRVIAPDLRTHGMTLQPAEPLTIEDMAQDVSALLRQLNITQVQVQVMGHSMGGLVAMALTQLQPALVGSLTLIDTSVQFADSPLWRFGTLLYPTLVKLRNRLSGWQAENLARAQAFTRHEVEPQYQQWVYHKRRLNQPVASFAAWWATRNCDASAWLAAVRVPTLIITGEHDSLIPPRMRERLSTLAPAARMVVIADGGHYPQLQFATQVNPLLVEHLAAATESASLPA